MNEQNMSLDENGCEEWYDMEFPADMLISEIDKITENRSRDPFNVPSFDGALTDWDRNR